MATWQMYPKGKLNRGNGVATVDFDSDTLRVMIVNSTYNPGSSAGTDDYISDIDTNEVSAGSTYSAKGPALASKTYTESGGTVTFDATDIVIAVDGTGFTDGRYPIIYKDTGVNTTSPVIAWGDMITDQSIQTGSLTIQFDNGGTHAIFTT